MKCSFSLEPSSVYTSFSRQQFLREVFEYRTAGSIRQLWNCAGHMFVSVSGMKQLITFDAKSLDYIQETEQTGCLDVEESVLNVMYKPPGVVLIVLKNGHLLYWSYGTQCKWNYHAKLGLSSTPSSTLTDVCFNISQNAFYCCEQEVVDDTGKSVCNIYKRQLIEDETMSTIKLGPISRLVTGCVPCTLYPTGHGVTCITKCKPGQACMVYSLCTLTGHIELLVDNKWKLLPNLTVHSPLAFKQIVIKSTPYIKKLQTQKVIKSTYIPQKQTVILLLETGSLVTLNHSGEKSIQVARLAGFDTSNLVDICFQYKHVCLIYNTVLRFHCIATGEHVCSIEAGDDCSYQGCSSLLLAGITTFIYTQDQLYVIKKCVNDTRDSLESNLLQHGHFQSDAVRLSYIDKMQKYKHDSENSLTIEKCRDRWLQKLGAPPTSKLSQTVEPFLQEYWKLETMLCEGLEIPKTMSGMAACTVQDEVSRLLSPKCALSRHSRQNQLFLLAQHFPLDVLDSLLEYLQVSDVSEEMSTSQQARWQSAITMETATTGGSNSDTDLPLFELLCHLLYKHRPDKLLQFLQCAQNVFDQKVGVSAFARRQHSLLMFERAVQCFLEPCDSAQPDTAIQVHAHILCTSDTKDSLLKVAHLLIKYEKWAECMELLQEYQGHTKHFTLIYQMVLTALTKHGVLSQYGEKIFSLMPSFTSADDVLQKTKRSSPGSVTKSEILLSNQPSSLGVSVDVVRPYLLQCLSEHGEFR